MIQESENKIEEIQASSGALSTECAEYKQGMADNEQARKDAEEIRAKEKKEFEVEQTDMVDGIAAIDKAIATLAEVGADQTVSSGADHEKFMGKKSLLGLKTSIKEALAAASVLLTNKQKRTMESFIQAPFTGTYTAQSGEIVGILKNMGDTFKENLASIRAAEEKAAAAHAKFMKIKEEEFETMKKGFDEKQGQLGDNDDELAMEKENLAELEKELASAEDFLEKLLAMCAKKAKEFEERNMMRANEEAAIAKAIAILNSDEAFNAFGKVKATKSGAMELQTSFLQIQQHNHQSSLRVSVLHLLQQAARKQKSLKIAKIVVMLQAENPFDTVLEEIEKMIAIIDEEAKADLEQKEWCASEREEYHQRKEDTERAISELEEKINTLDDTINNPETGLLKMIADTEESLKQNHESQTEQTTDRGKENRLYQENIKNIQVVKELLTKAIDVLKAYYSQFESEEGPGEEPASLLQADPKGPDTWEGEYKGQSEQGADVIKTLEFIKEESHKEETEAHQAENDAQHEFEDSMKDLKEEQTTLEESLAKYQLELAEAQKALAETKEELKKTEAELKAIKAYLLKIKPGCDYIAENFEEREKNRNLEKDALKKATAMLKDTPAYKKAVAEQEQEDLGKCKEICNAEGRDHAKCEACLAGTSVPGYCAGHKDTPGC
eukprot:gnl/MRDRNA2_/MRDRNA2_83946_c0_seq1.p1 gnl/MRDRNA2_/MRDRNA2_83946_c0~~gnl/MRDRNA2_/MRDRNA2_83946_c0_seq1.p1  ORF type:complete len:768 (-),score=287.21 gnl/MRDRNA2_/MRDRNA2_83946_c0_seq1:27-2033(-)